MATWEATSRVLVAGGRQLSGALQTVRSVPEAQQWLVEALYVYNDPMIKAR